MFDDLELPLKKSPLRKPGSNILRISLDPICLGTNVVQTLRKTLIESLGALVLVELLNLVDRFLGSERVGYELDYGAEHRETGRKFLDQSVPVIFRKGPKCANTFWMGTESNVNNAKDEK